MKKLLLGLCLATSFNVLADDPNLEGKMDVYDFKYLDHGGYNNSDDTSSTIMIYSSALVTTLEFNPVIGISVSTLFHCSALTEKAYQTHDTEATTVKSFELLTSCLVRMPIVPVVGTYDLVQSGVWEVSSDATTGISQGLDGYADALAMVQQEAIEQLVATEEGFGEEMPIAKVLIDDYIKNIKSGVSREEAAGLILDELDA